MNFRVMVVLLEKPWGILEEWTEDIPVELNDNVMVAVLVKV